MKRRWISLLIALALITGQISGCSIGDTEIEFQLNMLSDKNVFSVNGEKCSVEEFRLYMCNYKNLYGTAYGVDLWGNASEADSLETYVREVALDELSRIYCMEQIAGEQNITLSADEKEAVSLAAEEYYESLTKAERNYIGLKKSDLEDYYTRYALACKLYDVMTDGESEEISDDEARVIRVYQIYVTDADTAAAVENALAADEDFTTVASSYNEASVMELTVARGDYPEAVEEVAFNLEDEEISGMIAVDGGYYFIQCISKFEEELTEANKENIRQQREQEKLEEAYSTFVEEADFALNEEVWEDISLPEDLSEIVTDSFFEIWEKL